MNPDESSDVGPDVSPDVSPDESPDVSQELQVTNAGRAPDEAAFLAILHDIRHSRGKSVANSRPVPAWAHRVAWLLDSSIKVPGTGARVGIDGFITLIPGVGDAVGVTISLLVVLTGVGAGVSFPTILRMLLNVGIEGLVGLIPFGGALFDMVFKANIRNVVLMERDLADRRATRRSSIAILVLTAFVVVVGIVMIILLGVAAVLLTIWLISKAIG
ncbi:MAG: DUF4112 domain-containing protein [Microthrixaceae bacterium]